MDCSAFCFTETWLNPDIPDSATLQPPGFSLHRADRNPDLCHKTRGGGVCFMINQRWCKDVTVVSSHCSPDLESLIIRCRPFYSPREVSTVTMFGVYIHPSANGANALRELSDQITSIENEFPDTTVLIFGDFNHTNLKKVMPKFKQHVTCPTRDNKILDHCYTTIPNAYHSVPRAPLGKSDHRMVYLVPSYRQRLKTVKPVTRTVKIWNSDSRDALRGCFECTDWQVFRDSCDSLDEYTDVVTSYISFCENSVVPTKTVTYFGNDKPWFTKEMHDLVKKKDEAHKLDDKVGKKQAQYALEKEIKKGRKAYKDKLERKFQSGEANAVWQGIKTITDYKQKPASSSDDPTLPNQLNKFYARFDEANDTPITVPMHLPTELPPPFVIQEAEVKKLLSKQNPRKASGPDGVSTATLRNCSEQLAPVLTGIYNDSLRQGKVPSCFKASIIVPVPKKAKVSSLNDYRPVALTSVAMKVFERLVMQFLKTSTNSLSDPLQFAYKANRSVEDAVSLTLHKIVQHLDTQKSYARILFLDFSSAFNTIAPQKLYDKLLDGLHVDPQMCRWILDFLLERPQVVRIHNTLSDTLVLNTGAPQGCVLSPLLFTLFTNDCRSSNESVILVKFSDDTTISGLISQGDETSYREEVQSMVTWCEENNLVLNVSKTKEMIVDFRSKPSVINPLKINDEFVEIVQTFKFLGSIISCDLSWDAHILAARKKAQQRLYFLRQLKKFGVDQKILVQFYRSIIESVLTFSLTTWFPSTSVQNQQDLYRAVKAATKIIGCDLPTLDSIFEQRLIRKAKSILADDSHPGFHYFEPLPSGRRFRTIYTRTERSRNTFYPCAVKALSR